MQDNLWRGIVVNSLYLICPSHVASDRTRKGLSPQAQRPGAWYIYDVAWRVLVSKMCCWVPVFRK